MGEDQLEGGLELVQWLLSRFRGAQVKCHRDFDATACPGEYFPERAFTDEPSDWAQSGGGLGRGKGPHTGRRHGHELALAGDARGARRNTQKMGGWTWIT